MRLAQMTRLTPLFAMLACAGCVAGPRLSTTPAACASLLPKEWADGVSSAPIPQGDTVGDWIAFADAQTGRLDMANGRTADAIGIVTRCEARDAEALKRARPRILGLF